VRVLLDECVNPRVRTAFPGHVVETVQERGWRNLDDGPLLVMVQGNFDVLVTIDQGIEYQHNLKHLDFGIVVVHVRENRLEHYRPIFRAMLRAVEEVGRGRVLHVYGDQNR
jgi:predicted nuclease of predicted toxin-antitoxin system